MKVWIVRDLEPIPTDPDAPRLLRAGMLATALAKAGHHTTWFTSTFNHYSRQQRAAGDTVPQPGLTIRILEAPGYTRNIGPRRLLHNHLFSRAFVRAATAADQRPDVIIADLPTTDAAAAAIAFAKSHGIPSVLSIRDLWPDFFPSFAPGILKPLVSLAVTPLNWQARFACRHATSLIGISPGYLEWGQRKGARSRTSLDRIFPLGFPRPPRIGTIEDGISRLSKLGIPTDKHIVSFVGSWGRTYDLSLVLKTARLLADQRHDIVFALAGNAHERPDLAKALATLPNVRLVGWLGTDDVATLLSRSVIGLLPYAKDAPQGLPNKIYENLAYGALQVATLGEEAKNFYASTGGGVCVPPDNPNVLAATITANLMAGQDMHLRNQRIAIFNEQFEASVLYGRMIDHIAAVAQSNTPEIRLQST